MSELKTAFATGETVQISEDLSVKITTLSLYDISILLDKVKNVFAKLDYIKSEKPEGENVTLKDLLVAIIEEDKLPKLIIDMTTDLSSEQIDNLNAAASVAILSKSIEVNHDFFIQAVAPRLGELTAVILKTGAITSKA